VKAKARQVAVLCAAALAAWGAGQGLKAWQGERLGERIAAAAAPGDIVMISSLTCTYCREARQWFTAHEVPFSECFIEQDAACAEVYRRLLAPGTPTLLVRGQRQVGFDPRRIVGALDAG
jgi:hypothetical protein